MKFNRLRMSLRSQSLLGILKTRTGLTPNILGRFALCLSLKDPSTPNAEEVYANGSEIHPSVLFGEYEDIFMALMLKRLEKEGQFPPTREILDNMVRAHFNRGTIALYPRINTLSDFHTMIKQEKIQ